MTVLSAILLLFLVIDPIGNIPLFLCALKKVEPHKHRRIIIRELCIGFAILLLFLFFGRYILSLLQISQSSLGIAGGIILFMIAIKMVFSRSEKIFEGNNSDSEPFIVPLAIPLIAGPSSMTMVMLLMAREPSRVFIWLLALACAWIISSIILLSSSRLRKVFGKRGLTALERLMGMILTTIAVEMFITGIRQSFFS